MVRPLEFVAVVFPVNGWEYSLFHPGFGLFESLEMLGNLSGKSSLYRSLDFGVFGRENQARCNKHSSRRSFTLISITTGFYSLFQFLGHFGEEDSLIPI